MAQNFFVRLRDYYDQVAKVLRGEADAASVFANTSDIGLSRERAYAEFLKAHAPSKCNVFFGGFLFDDDGVESKQLDIVVTTDTAPRFNLHNTNGTGKSFSPVEGTLGVVSVKSTLNQAELYDALEGIASIPRTRDLGGRVNSLLKVKNYEDWPLKVIYATKGIAPQTLLAHLTQYYVGRPEIPLFRRPNFIHVSGSCLIVRATDGMSVRDAGSSNDLPLPVGTFHLITINPDVQAILWTLNELQQKATASSQILFSYNAFINKIADAT